MKLARLNMSAQFAELGPTSTDVAEIERTDRSRYFARAAKQRQYCQTRVRNFHICWQIMPKLFVLSRRCARAGVVYRTIAIHNNTMIGGATSNPSVVVAGARAVDGLTVPGRSGVVIRTGMGWRPHRCGQNAHACVCGVWLLGPIASTTARWVGLERQQNGKEHTPQEGPLPGAGGRRRHRSWAMPAAPAAETGEQPFAQGHRQQVLRTICNPWPHSVWIS